jgi:hypothetical protein
MKGIHIGNQGDPANVENNRYFAPRAKSGLFFHAGKIELRISKIFNRDEVEVKYLKFLTRFYPSGKNTFPRGANSIFYHKDWVEKLVIIIIGRNIIRNDSTEKKRSILFII